MAAKDPSGYDHLLRDNYESPVYAPALGVSDQQLQQMAEMLKVSVTDFAAHAKSLRSPDELSVYVARQLMRQLAPSLLWITLHDIDVAHAGTYSLYIDAIQRSDRLCGEIWQMIQSEPEYAGKTTMFILPDFGRDSDEVLRRQWLSTSPHRRCVFQNHLDDGERRRCKGKCDRRSSRGVD